MHQILVLYNPPKDPQHFRDYYVKTHIPLCKKLPGLKGIRYTFEPGALLGAKSPYYGVCELDSPTLLRWGRRRARRWWTT